MDAETIRVIAEIVLLILGTFFGAKWKGAKDTAKNGVAVAQDKTNQAFSVANRIIRAAEDDHVTPEEVQEIALSVKEFLPQKEV